LSPDAQSSFDLLAENKTDPTIVTDSDYNTYVNSQLGFKFKYPKDWETINQNIYVNSSDDFSSDPKVIELHPSKYVGVMGSLYRPSFEMEETYWPFQGVSPKYLFDLHNQTREQFAEQDYKMVDYGPVTIAGNPGFKFILEYVSEAERSLGLPEEKRTQVTVTTLINEHMYTLSFSSYSSQFGSYAPLVEDILNSFGPYPTLNAPLNQNQNSNTNITLGDGLSVSPTPDTNNLLIRNATDAQSEAIQEKLITRDNQNVTANIVFSTYTDEKYGFSIKYPSNVGLGKPLDLEAVNKTLIGINFDLDNSSILSGSPDVTVAGFYPNETYLMSRLIGVTPSLPNHTNFSIDSVASIANQELSFYQMLPGFMLLENDTINLNHNLAYSMEYKYFNPVYRGILQTKEVYVSHDDRLVVFQYSSNPSKYYQYLPTFQEMINSLDFEN
jgi:hypothetical protein